MIKIEGAHIEEVRGIRRLDIDLRRSTFAVSGPNGSGKSGVIDAIEFCLTGQIGRLAGRGTRGLTVAEHGPHVDKIKFPDASFVTLDVFFPKLNKTASITRKVSAPRKPLIVPPDADIRAAFADIAAHPEITLSRREILRFILVEPTKRSEEIQAILKLDAVGDTRSAPNTAQNRCQTAEAAADASVSSARQALQIHLQIPTLRSEDLLAAVNQRRSILGLSAFTELSADTQLDTGLSAESRIESFNKGSALRDLKAFQDALSELAERGNGEVVSILTSLQLLEADPNLLVALQRRNFIEKGLELVDGPACPLCDTGWDEAHLREHLKEKLRKSEQARLVQQNLLDNGRMLGSEVMAFGGLVKLAYG